MITTRTYRRCHATNASSKSGHCSSNVPVAYRSHLFLFLSTLLTQHEKSTRQPHIFVQNFMYISKYGSVDTRTGRTKRICLVMVV